MMVNPASLEDILRSSTRALVVGVGGGGDVVGALGAARFLELWNLTCIVGGLSWERYVYDPTPGPRSLDEVEHLRRVHPRVGLANAKTRTRGGVHFAESKMAALYGKETLLVDINGGVRGVVEGIEAALERLEADLLVGIDVGGDSLAQGGEKGLGSPLADSMMLAAYAQLEERGRKVLWGVFGYGSDGELTGEELEKALSIVAKGGGLLGAWSLTRKVVDELDSVVRDVPTEASALPLECARGAWGERKIREGRRTVRLTPLAALTFYLSPGVVYERLSRPARCVVESTSLEEANEALHAMGLRTELDYERERLQRERGSRP